MINPNTFRLGKKLTWWTVGHYNIINKSYSRIGYKILHEDRIIRELIEKLLKSLNKISSEIIILRKWNISKNEIKINEKWSGKLEKRKYQLEEFINKKNNLDNMRNELIIKMLVVQGPKRKKEEIRKKIKGEIYNIENLLYYIKKWEEKKKLKLIEEIRNKKVKRINKKENMIEIGRLLKDIIENILNRGIKNYNVKIDMRETEIGKNSKILSEWIGREIEKNARNHKWVIKRIIERIEENKNLRKEKKRKNDKFINKSKNIR